MQALYGAISAVLYLVAYFWIVGFLPIGMFMRAKWGEPYSTKRDLAMTAVFVLYMGLGLAIFRYVIPNEINPFCDGSFCSWHEGED